MKNEIKRFTFRIPNELFDKIEAVANDNHRSVNAEIIVAIEHYLDSHSEEDLSNHS